MLQKVLIGQNVRAMERIPARFRQMALQNGGIADRCVT